MVQLQRKEEGEKKGTSRSGKVDGRRGKEGEGVQRLWGMLYADDARMVSRSSEGLERTMTVIVTACSSFGLTVSEAKTEICYGHIVTVDRSCTFEYALVPIGTPSCRSPSGSYKFLASLCSVLLCLP